MQDSAPLIECLDENAVVGFLQGTLARERERAVGAHLDDCRDCRDLLAAVASTVPPPSGLTKALEGELKGLSLSQDGLPSPGQVLASRFHLGRVVGRGGMGVVYEARDLVLKVPVAVKVLQPALAERPSLMEHLHHEILLGRRISHPRVCRIYDLGTTDRLHFITMELVAGETLEARLMRARLPPLEAAEVLDQVLSALEAAHKVGVVHRDLKPANIMIDGSGGVKVMDFGLARDLEAEKSRHAGPVGTPAYWAPEQARGEPASPASDIYSVGVVALRVLGEAAPTAFRPFIAKCLQPRPEQRFGSAQQAQAALRRARDAHRTRGALARRTQLAGWALCGSGLLGWGWLLGIWTQRWLAGGRHWP